MYTTCIPVYLYTYKYKLRRLYMLPMMTIIHCIKKIVFYSYYKN